MKKPNRSMPWWAKPTTVTSTTFAGDMSAKRTYYKPSKMPNLARWKKVVLVREREPCASVLKGASGPGPGEFGIRLVDDDDGPGGTLVGRLDDVEAESRPGGVVG